MRNDMIVGPGALVTVMNVSTDQRKHFFISPNGSTETIQSRNSEVKTVQPDDDIAQALIGKMSGDEVFHRHDLAIEHIEWPEAL
jgi:transcription elongation GreA/GreB family factor